MKFEIPPLPYDKSALEPHVSSRTMDFHYEKHHKGYLAKLRQTIGGKPEAERTLEDLICTSQGPVYDLAAQVWNHTFYWRSLRAGGGGKPGGELLSALEDAFGSFADFKQALAEAANGEFGSGWASLLLDAGGRLRVRSSSDADNPLGSAQVPLLTIDAWEHAHYLDYQNRRDRYVQGVLDHLLNWDFAEQNLERRGTR